MADSAKVSGSKGRRRDRRPTMPGARGVVPDDVEVDLPTRRHLEGCPAEDDPDSLDFWTFVPKTGDHVGQEVVMIRCVRCGGERAVTLAQLREEQAEDDD